MMFRLYDFGSVVYLAYFSARTCFARIGLDCTGTGSGSLSYTLFICILFITWRYSRTSK